METGTDSDAAFDLALRRLDMGLLEEAREPAKAVFQDLADSARLLREAAAAAPESDPHWDSFGAHPTPERK